MKVGDRVFETIDGGLCPARVVAVLDRTNRVLVQLLPNTFGDPESFRNRGYLLFRPESLTSVQ